MELLKIRRTLSLVVVYIWCEVHWGEEIARELLVLVRDF